MLLEYEYVRDRDEAWESLFLARCGWFWEIEGIMKSH
jgi:hypothetical protein